MDAEQHGHDRVHQVGGEHRGIRKVRPLRVHHEDGHEDDGERAELDDVVGPVIAREAPGIEHLGILEVKNEHDGVERDPEVDAPAGDGFRIRDQERELELPGEVHGKADPRHGRRVVFVEAPDDDQVDAGPGQRTEGDQENGTPTHVGEHILDPEAPAFVGSLHDGVAPLHAGVLGQAREDPLDEIENHCYYSSFSQSQM